MAKEAVTEIDEIDMENIKIRVGRSNAEEGKETSRYKVHGNIYLKSVSVGFYLCLAA